MRKRLRCMLLRGGHDWYEFRANFVTVYYYCQDCGKRQIDKPKRDRTVGKLNNA